MEFRWAVSPPMFDALSSTSVDTPVRVRESSSVSREIFSLKKSSSVNAVSIMSRLYPERIVSPFSSGSDDPPSTISIAFEPIRLLLTIFASESAGMGYCRRTVSRSTTRALRAGSKRISETVPTFTPRIITGEAPCTPFT